MQDLNVALVTGSSSGMGFEIALLLARTGFHTYASMREQNKEQKEITQQRQGPFILIYVCIKVLLTY
jgi:NAD(P)-dependent dehydrogenase (short-subunit alcohol dehydrogenase family)